MNAARPTRIDHESGLLASTVSAPSARVRVLIEPTNEEWIAAAHARRLLRGPAPVNQEYAVA